MGDICFFGKIQGGDQQDSVVGARQRVVVILASLVALEKLHRLKLGTAGFATGRGVQTADSVTVTTRPAVIAQHCEALELHSTRFTEVLPLDPADPLGIVSLLALRKAAQGATRLHNGRESQIK